MKVVPHDEALAQDRMAPLQNGGADPCLEIEFDQSAGWVRIYDPRLFQAARRRFCERLLVATTRQPEIKKAEVDLPSASCRIEFGPGVHTQESMADSFVRAIASASAAGSLIDRLAWWRRRGKWSAITAFRLPEGESVWEAFEAEPAQIRLRRAGVAGDRTRLARLADSLAEIEGVEACRVSPWSHRMTIDVCKDSPISDRFLDTVEQAMACVNATDLLRPEWPSLSPLLEEHGAVAVATGGKRVWYLAMAGGSFALTLVGLVVPGIPTVPFLLATSYYLARSSPRLNDRLRRTSFFGPILREWEQQGGLSPLSKQKLTGLTLAIVAITIVLAPLTPVTLVIILIISSLSIYGIARMPEVAGEPQLEGQEVRPVLTAP